MIEKAIGWLFVLVLIVVGSYTLLAELTKDSHVTVTNALIGAACYFIAGTLLFNDRFTGAVRSLIDAWRGVKS